MGRRFSSISGFVLAGGASRRMGRPKAQLQWEGETLLERQVRLLRSVCRSVAVLGPPENFPGASVPVYADEVPGHGPLGGIYTGLLRTRTEFNLFVGCDMPNLSPEFFRFLCRRGLETQADATFPESPDHGANPLCAVYRRRALAAIRATLETNENWVVAFFPHVRCEPIPWREIASAGFRARIFDNLNTLEDYAAARKKMSSKGRP